MTGVEIAFLLGIPRSGTTLLSYLLDRHPEITVPPEPWLLLALDAFGRTCIRHPASSHYLGQAITELSAGIDLAAAQRAMAWNIYQQLGAKVGKRWVVDKSPRYYQVLPLLDTLFPSAPRILLRRNPFAVAASMKTSWGLDLISTLHHLPGHPLILDLVLGPRRLEDYCESLAPPQSGRRLQILSYEALTSDPVKQVRQLQQFLGVAELDPPRELNAANSAYASASLGDRNILMRGDVSSDTIDRWQTALTRSEMQAVHDVCGAPLLHHMGYGAEAEAAYAKGVIDQGPEQTASSVARVIAAESARQADVMRAGSAAGVADALSLATDQAFADPVRVLAAMNAVQEQENTTS